MNFMIPLFMAALPALSFAQSQPEAGQSLPSAAIPKITAVFVIQTPKQGVTVQQVMAMHAGRDSGDGKLYLDGKIREWYSRGDGKGVILLVDAKSEDEARALMETLPLAKAHLMDHDLHSRRAADAPTDAESSCVPVTARNGAAAGGTSFTKETIMIKPRIIVTGATGKTGSVVVTELLKAGYPVRAMVRREDGRSARLKAQGAEIAVADMSDVERVADALKDVQRAYYCPPLDPYMIQGAVAFAVAAKEARLEHIVSPDPMAGESLASFAHDPPALAGRSAVLDDARSRAYDRQPGLFR